MRSPSLLLGLLWLLDHPFTVQARRQCISMIDCENKVRKGSQCLGGFCTNPYHVGGCLSSHLKEHFKLRTCNSDDDPSAAEKGYCQPSELDYTEVRVSSQNWESVFFVSWILQILLGELLDIPVTIETSDADANVNFYDLEARFEYGKPNDWDSIRQSKQTPDCREVKGVQPYTPCTHVIPEVWANHEQTLTDLQENDVIEPSGGLGALGQQMWFMRRKTAMQYPQFMTYLGLQGEINRPKLAEVFKRPTKFGDYCAEVSADNCETADKYAFRAPSDKGESAKYYVEGAFDGYFLATSRNNCTEFRDNCTGHIVDYPCGWSSFIEAQTYHLGIALESNGNHSGSNGYSYSEMVQIWTAANATDEHVLMQWWRPEALYQEFLGTDSEFQGVSLPPPTQDCIDNRVHPADRCGDDPVKRLGNPLGACAEAPHALYKVVSKALYDISFDPDKPEALHSPAYEAINNFRITDLQMGKIFDYWFEIDVDKWNMDPRDATCRWVVENLEELKTFIPRAHPRTLEDNDGAYKEPVFRAALALSCVAIAFTVVSSLFIYIQREKPCIRYAQVEFLFFILFGLLLVSLGSLTTALVPTDSLCVAIEWLVNIGYTLELVPLIVKVAAINRLMTAMAQMKRVKLRKSSLFGAVFLVCACVCVFLVIWTAIDPSNRGAQLDLTDNKNDAGVTIVERTYYCTSDQEFWHYISVSWQLLLLLCASVLAFQTRKMREDLNETRTLAMMIYSHFLFVLLQGLTYLLDGDSVNQAFLAAARSIIFSCDSIATLIIYFVPKFLASQKNQAPWLKNSSNPEQPAPLNVHMWQSGQPSTLSRRMNLENDSDDEEPPAVHRPQRLASLRESSIDYRTQAEWEDQKENKDLRVLSEEDSGGFEQESVDDENCPRFEVDDIPHSRNEQ